ncbi:hypothetical protein GINT2_000207 [Glugoides intestinalis]
MLQFLAILHLALGLQEVDQEIHFIEKEVMGIRDIETLKANAKFSNAVQAGESIILRSSKGAGSLVNINEEVTVDNWSLEFVVKHLFLHDVEKAGIYMWYTDKPLVSGKYKGGEPVFNGFVTGIEFSKERADIVFAFNYGLDFENKDLQTMRFDHINPLAIEHHDEFKVKIIHTEKNFKVELYDLDGHLLSDSFRIHEPLIMNRGNHKKNFAITTNYEHSAKDVFLELKELKISTREESERYNVAELHTEYNQYPRNKSDEELRAAVADATHFLSYLTVVLGTKDNNMIVEMVLVVKKRLRMLRESIEAVTSMLNASGEGGKLSVMSTKMNDLEMLSKELNLKIEAIKSKLGKQNTADGGVSTNRTFQMVKLAIAFSIGTVFRTIWEKVFFATKQGKKE